MNIFREIKLMLKHLGKPNTKATKTGDEEE